MFIFLANCSTASVDTHLKCVQCLNLKKNWLCVSVYHMQICTFVHTCELYFSCLCVSVTYFRVCLSLMFTVRMTIQCSLLRIPTIPVLYAQDWDYRHRTPSLLEWQASALLSPCPPSQLWILSLGLTDTGHHARLFTSSLGIWT